MKRYQFLSLFLIIISFFCVLSSVSLATTYVADLYFTTSNSVYTANENIPIKGYLYMTTLSNTTVSSNHTAVSGGIINISIVNSTGSVISSYNTTTTSSGFFYSYSSYYTNGTNITAPSTRGRYNIHANYTDTSGAVWHARAEIQVENTSVDMYSVNADKVSYDPSESMSITIKAVQQVGDSIGFVPNVSINGTIRNSTKSILTNFNCTTNAAGRCIISTTSPSSYGDYFIEVNNFKGFTSFEVIRFTVNVDMRDEIGETVKHTFILNEQGSVYVSVPSNSTSETYTASAVVKNLAGTTIKDLGSATLNYNNSYNNRITFTVDSLNFVSGTYKVYVTVSKTGDGSVSEVTSFEVKSWDLSMKKRELNSGFEYDYSAFPSKIVFMEVYPTFRANASSIPNISSGYTSINLKDTMGNTLNSTNLTWNSSCGTSGCYQFNMTLPSSAGRYSFVVSVTHDSYTQTASKDVFIVSKSMFTKTADSEGNLKELFGADDYIYIYLTAKNATHSNVTLSDSNVITVSYMNGTDINYTEVANFSLVNNSNSINEWAWNSTTQRLKIDAPNNGGLYNIYISADNNSAVTSTKFIINPYDICGVPKNTPGQMSDGYYYVYQFQTTDTVYYELKIYQANNPLGRATAQNTTGNSSINGMGSACRDYSTTKQVVSNASIIIDEVKNEDTGKIHTLNSSASSCKMDNNNGTYTCTLKPIGKWDGGRYSAKFTVTSQDRGTTDIAYGGFEARAFYIYSYPNRWRIKPDATVSLNINMYEAGNGWWTGSSGLSGSVLLSKVEYMGSDGEWLPTPISYNYNTSNVNASSISSGSGTMSLPASNCPNGEWKTGYYRAYLKGTNSDGEVDYGYAWFNVKNWEVYASPVDCEGGGGCTYAYNINSRSNVSLYVTVNNAGEWGQTGQSLGGNITIRVKKLMDCRNWPCTVLNTSNYTSTSIIVNESNTWYWNGVNNSYVINLTPESGTWGTGYWQVVFDVNGTETGTGWFNTIAFYIETYPTDSSGNNWKYSVKNNESVYFKTTTVRSQKGYYYGDYNATDYINTTIVNATLKTWGSGYDYSMTEYTYPDDFNISIVGGGSVINGTRVLNISYENGDWPTGYYNGELTLKNSLNETATSWLWFDAKPFRVSIYPEQYTIDDTACVNGTIAVYEPDYSSNILVNSSFNISSIKEQIWSGYYPTTTVYTNFTPSSFNRTDNFTICPDNGTWSQGSWGNYHYMTVNVTDSEGKSQNGWLSFRALPFYASWGSIVSGTDVNKGNAITVPVTITKYSTGEETNGTLERIYQWRYDSYYTGEEEYDFSVGDCDTRTGDTSCNITGSQSITIYPPSHGWRDGYNSLYAEWTGMQDWSGIWFNGIEPYSGWYDNTNEYGGYKYRFYIYENLTIKLQVRNASTGGIVNGGVNVTKVEYSTPSLTCWDDYCRTYNNVSFEIVNNDAGNYTIGSSGIINIIKPANWTRGYIAIRATVTGPGGSTIIKGGEVYIRGDYSPPVIIITSPELASVQNSSAMIPKVSLSWTTNKNANCYLYLWNYDQYYTSYCANSSANNSTVWHNQTCNNSIFNGTNYYYSYAGSNYQYWSEGGSNYGYRSLDNSGYRSLGNVINTGGTSHSATFNFSVANITNQSYAMSVTCWDEDYAYATNKTAFNFTRLMDPPSITLLYPEDNQTVNTTVVWFNYSVTGLAKSNCSLYGNWTGEWALNQTDTIPYPIVNDSFYNITGNGTFIWNIKCTDYYIPTNDAWAEATNRTFTVNATE